MCQNSIWKCIKMPKTILVILEKKNSEQIQFLVYCSTKSNQMTEHIRENILWVAQMTHANL